MRPSRAGQEIDNVGAHHIAGYEGYAGKQFGKMRFDVSEKCRAIHFRHANIGQDDVEIIFLQVVERPFSGVGDRDVVAIAFEHISQHVGDVRFVVNDQYPERLPRFRVQLSIPKTWRQAIGEG